MRGFIPILILLVAVTTCAASTHAQASEGLDLRAKISEFSQATNKKRWHIEDELTHRERLFQDGLIQEYRDALAQGLGQVRKASNWKQAQHAYKEQMRHELRQLRQKVRIHRDEFDLTLLASTNELDKDLKDFLTPIEEEFRNNKSDAYQKAESDFDSARDDLKEDLQNWKERVKSLKTSSDFLSNY